MAQDEFWKKTPNGSKHPTIISEENYFSPAGIAKEKEKRRRLGVKNFSDIKEETELQIEQFLTKLKTDLLFRLLFFSDFHLIEFYFHPKAFFSAELTRWRSLRTQFDDDYYYELKANQPLTLSERSEWIEPEQLKFMDELYQKNDRIQLTVLKSEYEHLMLLYVSKRSTILNDYRKELRVIFNESLSDLTLSDAFKTGISELLTKIEEHEREYGISASLLTLEARMASFNKQQEDIEQLNMEFNVLCAQEPPSSGLDKLKANIARINTKRIDAEKALDEAFLPRIKELAREIQALTQQIGKDMKAGLSSLKSILGNIPDNIFDRTSKIQFDEVFNQLDQQIRSYKKANSNEKNVHLTQCTNSLRTLSAIMQDIPNLAQMNTQLQVIQEMIAAELAETITLPLDTVFIEHFVPAPTPAPPVSNPVQVFRAGLSELRNTAPTTESQEVLTQESDQEVTIDSDLLQQVNQHLTEALKKIIKKKYLNQSAIDFMKDASQRLESTGKLTHGEIEQISQNLNELADMNPDEDSFNAALTDFNSIKEATMSNNLSYGPG